MSDKITPDQQTTLDQIEEMRQTFLKKANLPGDSTYNLHESMAHAGYDMKNPKHTVSLSLATIIDDLLLILKEGA
jgi:hypothetical protein